ncbi:MAG: hypothetical protein LBS96_01125 [Oscillospiraceae bacterium]|nr:hypothetical protein [Oscillospiraceae bacterium]
MGEPIWIGMDGGGTKTLALAARRDGSLVAAARAGSINFFSVGWEEARAQLRSIVQALSAATGGAPVASAFIGHAALAGSAEPGQLRRLAEGILEADMLGMESDLCVALEAMPGEGAKAVAVSGTGSMVAGRASPGAQLLTCGGWGYLLGDEGSGFHLAWEGVRAALRGSEKSAAATELTGALLRHFGANEPAALLPLFYEPPMERHRLAGFARAVLACAEAGDAPALAIVRHGAGEFAQTTAALLRRLPQGAALGLWGGVMVGSACYRAAFCGALAVEFPALRPALLPCPPEAGALFAAFRQSGQTLQPAQRARLIDSGHEKGWF